ncbi:TadE/TadG family type IV pilus assembly protein [Novosphingobium sp. ZN18A2]|uniref:TadE/TadG family type IV pilus assembly protein n=1 Tax=Novosphingobium sp. ZN18A2 TaxID=3079861 RepID=UPI0030D43B96
MTRCRALTAFHDLLRARSGVATIEFALSVPLLLSVGLWGVETANVAMVHMRINQLATQIADNASRIGDTSQLSNRKIYESDIDDILAGANIQSGNIGLFDHGRVIISSLEVVPGEADQQYIHWQRCMGAKDVTSAYGGEGTGLGGGLSGMGPAGDEITASKGDAVMFVEVTYDYQPIVSKLFTAAKTISTTAAFNVRDSRDLTQIYQRDPNNPDRVASCDVFEGYPKT